MTHRGARPAATAAVLGLAVVLRLALPAAAGAASSRSEIAPHATAESHPAVTTSDERTLRQLAAEVSAVVVGGVTRSEPYDEDRLEVHRLRVERVLRGRVDDPEPGIVDIRAVSKRPPVLIVGERVVVLLRPAPALSYLAQHLPPGTFFESVGGRQGVVPLGSDAEVDDVARALVDGAAIATMDAVAARSAARRLAFFELASPNGRLIADGLAELRQLPELKSLSREEVETLGRVLRNRAVDRNVRIGLVRLVAERHATEARPALATAETDDARVLEAVLVARAALGGADRRADIDPHLASEDPAVRAAAVRALGQIRDGSVIPDLERYATVDPDPKVRVAAIEALGATKQPAAVPVLARTFQAGSVPAMQASARAMLAMDASVVDDAFVDLALRGRTPEARRYAAAVLVLSRGRTDPAVRRIEAANPPPEVRDLLEHGLQDPHHAQP